MKIRIVGIRANIKAKITIPKEPKIADPPQIIAIHAPHAAPWDTPIVEGAASGFPKLLCKIHPHIPSIEPTNIEVRTWGSLRLNNISAPLLSGLFR